VHKNYKRIVFFVYSSSTGTFVCLEQDFCQDSTNPELVTFRVEKITRRTRFKVVKLARVFCLYNEDRPKSACFKPDAQFSLRRNTHHINDDLFF
jgi:hypothetical protein